MTPSARAVTTSLDRVASTASSRASFQWDATVGVLEEVESDVHASRQKHRAPMVNPWRQHWDGMLVLSDAVRKDELRWLEMPSVGRRRSLNSLPTRASLRKEHWVAASVTRPAPR